MSDGGANDGNAMRAAVDASMRAAVDTSMRAAVDASMIDRCERHTRSADRLRREPKLPLVLRVPRLHVDPADWGAGYLQVHERELPMELADDLRQLMPQALLRDLYRPVQEVGWVERPLIEGTTDRAGVAAMQQVRDARTLPTLPRIEPATRTVRAYQTWRRHLLAERWQPILADHEPRRPVVT